MARGRPAAWSARANEAEAAMRRRVTKGQPVGRLSWVEQMVPQWNLGATFRERERPKKERVTNGF